jgi:HEAT repeat protein
MAALSDKEGEGMGRDLHDRGGPESGSNWKPARRGRPGFSIPWSRLAAVVLLGLLSLLIGQWLWEGGHPSAPAARASRVNDAAARVAAVRELGLLGPEDPDVALPALTDRLRDEDPAVRASAASCLVAVLYGATQSGVDPREVQRAAATLLALIKDAKSDVRAAAAIALGQAVTRTQGTSIGIGLDTIHEALRLASTDPEPAVRVAAMRGLGMVGSRTGPVPAPELFRALEDNAEPVRTAAAIALASFREGLLEAVPALVRSFEKARPEFRPGYATVLDAIRPGGFSAEAVPLLANALSSADEGVRFAAANDIGAFGKAGQRAIPALIESLGRPSKEVAPPNLESDPAFAAARALASIADTYSTAVEVGPPIDARSLRTLARVVKSGSPPIRLFVARALGHFQPTPEVVPLLGELAADPDANVRAAAARSLDEVGHRQAFVPPASVARALEDPDRNVRYWAAGAIGHSGRGIDPLIPAMLQHAEHDPDENVRSCVAMELRMFIQPPGVTPAVIPLLTEALKSPDRETRSAACSLLGKFGPEVAGAIPELLRLLREGQNLPRLVAGQNMTDQSAVAATALARIAPGTPRAGEVADALVKYIQAETRDPDLDLVKALSRFGPLAKGAIPRLEEMERKAISINAPAQVKILREAIEALRPGR